MDPGAGERFAVVREAPITSARDCGSAIESKGAAASPTATKA
jgi:hypothetical protein